ncbi:AI-2E family transporter [Rhodopila sp.]|uniref:AI-2E family transporter n=1 Tax=Rhodopila sp. TaxID=2480087 RepID=UPI003D097AA4
MNRDIMGPSTDQAAATQNPEQGGVAPDRAPASASGPQQGARAALAMLLIGLGLWTLHRYVPALIWAAILAIAVWPLYQRATRRWPPGKHNILLPSVFTVLIALLFLVPLVLVAVQAGREVHGVLDSIAQARSGGIPPPEWLGHLPIGARQATDWWQANLADAESANELLRRARQSQLVSNSGQIGADIAHRAVLFGFMLLTLFFLFKDGEGLGNQLQRASARAFGPAGERIGRQMIASVHGTVDGLVLVGLGEGFILGIGYLILGVPHPTLFGLFTAIAAMVPFGAAVVFGIAALILLIQGSVASAIIIGAAGMVVTFVADHFIRPTLIGSATRLPFLWVLLGILGGVETWGLLGLFLGPAIMAALMLLWREWAARRPAV